MTKTELYDILLSAQEAIQACMDQDEPFDTDGPMLDDSGERENDYYAARVGHND